jgi:hypothetical protein
MEIIFENANWKLSQRKDTDYPGYLILSLKSNLLKALKDKLVDIESKFND